MLRRPSALSDRVPASSRKVRRPQRRPPQPLHGAHQPGVATRDQMSISRSQSNYMFCQTQGMLTVVPEFVRAIRTWKEAREKHPGSITCAVLFSTGWSCSARGSRLVCSWRSLAKNHGRVDLGRERCPTWNAQCGHSRWWTSLPRWKSGGTSPVMWYR